MPLPPPQPPPPSWPASLYFGRRRKLWHIVPPEQIVPTYLRKFKKDPKWIIRGIQQFAQRRYFPCRSGHDVSTVSTKKHYRTQEARKNFTTTHNFNIILITFSKTISKLPHKTNKQDGDNTLREKMVLRTTQHAHTRHQGKINRLWGSRHDGTTEQTAIWQCNKNNPISCSCTAGDSIVK